LGLGKKKQHYLSMGERKKTWETHHGSDTGDERARRKGLKELRQEIPGIAGNMREELVGNISVEWQARLKGREKGYVPQNLPSR